MHTRIFIREFTLATLVCVYFHVQIRFARVRIVMTDSHIYRRVIDQSNFSKCVSKLVECFGVGEQIDEFRERYLFVPQNEVGNMNYIHRNILVEIVYASDGSCCVYQLSETADGSTVACNSLWNIRRMFMKAGFKIIGDFAQKGLRFNTRNDGTCIVISRPYNAVLACENTTWNSLPGPLPFGNDYLIEVTQTGTATTKSLSQLVDKLIGHNDNKFEPISRCRRY